MKIHDDHLYHGAALIQIAEHPVFKAINSLQIGGIRSHVAYEINTGIGVYLKYASKARPRYGEYVFSFQDEQFVELEAISKAMKKTFVGLVCVADREICLLSYLQLKELKREREVALGGPEKVLQVLVTVPEGRSLRVYVNEPGKKGKYLGEQVVSRKNFPEKIFE